MIKSKEIYNKYLNSYAISDEILEKLKQENLVILKDVIDICNNNDIQYIVGYGTALGAVRHNGFIPWDDDIDMHILRKDVEKLKNIITIECSNRYEYISYDTVKECALPFIKISKIGTELVEAESDNYPFKMGYNIDIFPLDNVSEGKMFALKGKASRLCSIMAVLECDYKYPSITFSKLSKENKAVKKYYAFRRTVGFFASILPIRVWMNLWKKFTVSKKQSNKVFYRGNQFSALSIDDIYSAVTVKFENLEVKVA